MRNLLLAFILMFPGFQVDGQTIPIGQCGLQYNYDAAGNLISREYVCINVAKVTQQSTLKSQKEPESVFMQQVEALYPNPTTGQFTVRFTLPLENAVVRILDLNGRVLQQFKAVGTLVHCNTSQVAPGTYYIQVIDKNTHLFQKFIKQ